MPDEPKFENDIFVALVPSRAKIATINGTRMPSSSDIESSASQSAATSTGLLITLTEMSDCGRTPLLINVIASELPFRSSRYRLVRQEIRRNPVDRMNAF